MKQNDIKNALNEIKPDDHIKTRLEAKVSEKIKPKTHHRAFTAGIAAVLCIAIVAVSMGISGITIKTNPISPTTAAEPTQTVTATSRIAPGFVMFAYADETDSKEKQEEQYLDVSLPGIYSVNTTDIRGMSEKEIEYKAKEIMKSSSNFHVQADMTTISVERLDNVLISQIKGGEFDFDLSKQQADDVKEIRVKTENIGYSVMEIRAYDKMYYDNLKPTDTKNIKDFYILSDESGVAKISGRRFKKCIEVEENTDMENMFGITWKMGDKLYDALNADPNMDLTTVKDTITFEVEFNDGTVSRSVIEIGFDENSQMFASPKAFDFINK